MDNYTHINYNKNEIQKAAMEALVVAPLNPSVGQFYFDLTLKAFRVWDGKQWISNADLPIASDKVLGAIRVGSRLTIDPDDGTLSADIQSDNNLTDDLRDAILNIPNTVQKHNEDVTAHPYITGLISQEVFDRQSGDNNLQTSISDEIQRALSEEANLRSTKEDKSNKTQVVSQSSSSEQYPSARAVYQALQEKVSINGNIEASNEYRVVRYDSKGLVTGGRKIINADLSAGIDAAKIGDGLVTNTEFKNLQGSTSNLQTQINNLGNEKANKIDGQDLVDVKEELEKKIKDTNDIIGNKTFPETLVSRINTLSTIPTIMQADNSQYVVSYINITESGSGYRLNETFYVGNGGTVPVVITSVNANGGISQLTWDNSPQTIDISGKDLEPQQYEGEGTGATFEVLTRYASGNQVVNGEILYVPNEDPLVQFTRMKGYVDAAVASQMDLSIDGYVSTSDPSRLVTSIAIGSKWYQNSSTTSPDTNFPWQVRIWDGTNWSSDSQDYYPKINDIWSNLNVSDPLVSSGYYWFDKWVPYGFSFDPEYFVHTVNNQTIGGIKTFSNTIVGNIDTADRLRTPRNIMLEGMVTGNVDFDGSMGVSIDTKIENDMITTDMLKNNVVTSNKISNVGLTELSNNYNRTNYQAGDTNSYQNWLNSLASKINYLLDSKNTVFVQSATPTPNNIGDLWIQTVAE